MQIDAASIVPIRRCCPNTPKRTGKELLLQRAIVVALVEIHTKVMPLEVGENVLYQERAAIGNFDSRKARAIVHFMQEGGGRGKQLVHIAADRIKHGVQVGYAAVMLNQHVSNVTGTAPDLVEEPAAFSCVFSLLVNS